MECLRQQYDVRTLVMSLPDLGYGLGQFFIYPNNSGANQLKPIVGHVEMDDQLETVAKRSGKDEEEKDKESQDTNSDSETATADTELNSNSQHVHRRKTAKASYVCKSALPSLNITGHTGFLTFATLYP